MEHFDAFCEAVCRQVRHATPRERRAIRGELTGHLEDRAEVLRSRGLDEAQAEEAAVAAMGDPERIGRELNRQYPLGWLLLSRCALAVAAVLVLSLFAPALMTFSSVQGNLSARFHPETAGSRLDSEAYIGRQALDLEYQGEGWSLRVCASALCREPDGTWTAAAAAVLYSHNPFTPLPEYLPGLIHLTEENHGSSFSDSGGAVIALYQAEVSRGQPMATMEIPLSASKTTCLDIPLDWKEAL